MTGRCIAIGDIHGCSTALHQIIDAICPTSRDTIVTLGDYVNRGPDSRGVMDQLIDLRNRCNFIPLLGNHDQLLLRNRLTRTEIAGYPVTDSDNGLERFRDEHFEFLESCLLCYEIDTHFFVHANFAANKKLTDQDAYTLLWLSLNSQMPKRHVSGKTAIVGHTPQHNGEILQRRHLKCIDTYCYGGGWLTAIDVLTGQTWQTNLHGVLRESHT